MDPSYGCERFDDVTEFAAEVSEWLATGPLTSNVAATLVAQRASGAVPVEPDALWLKVTRDDELIGIVLQTPPRELLVTTLEPAALDAVAETIALLRPRVVGVNGPKRTTDRFAALWSVSTGYAARIRFSSRLFQVTEVTAPDDVAGYRRPATAADRDTVTTWLRDWAENTGDSLAGLVQLADNYDNRIAAGQPQWIWEVDGEPVSFAMESTPSGGVVRLQAVITPPQRRGNGYASALVARISSDVLARESTRACTLYTDLSNPVSNSIYRRIGYRPIDDYASYTFEYPN